MVDNEYNRLEKVAKRYFKSLGNLAEMIGKPRQTFYTYKTKPGFGRRILDELQTKLNINPEYIRTGKGPMLLNQNNTKETNVSEVGNVEMIILPDIRTLTIEQMKDLKDKIDDYSRRLEKIIQVVEKSSETSVNDV